MFRELKKKLEWWSPEMILNLIIVIAVLIGASLYLIFVKAKDDIAKGDITVYFFVAAMWLAILALSVYMYRQGKLGWFLGKKGYPYSSMSVTRGQTSDPEKKRQRNYIKQLREERRKKEKNE